jgi:stage V sporulation protein G
MEITDVRVRLAKNRHDRLKAFCSITFDDEFVVRDIKIIERTDGYFVAMPSRKMTDHCEKCGSKNHLQAGFCNQCGATLPKDRGKKDTRGKTILYADIAHPTNPRCRQRIQREVVAMFKEEVGRSKQPGYVPAEMDEPDDDVPEVMR